MRERRGLVAPSVTDWISAISSSLAVLASLVALVAVFGVRKQVKLQRRQMKLELENVYVTRYWQIMDDLGRAPKGNVRNIDIERYLRLSEDQCDLRARHRITGSTWRYWRSGILEQLTDVEFGEGLAQARIDLFDHLRKLSINPSYDPLAGHSSQPEGAKPAA
jgi:hypothetical protein